MTISILNSNRAKFIFSCIGTLFFYVGAMFCVSLGQFSVYITSYFHYQNISIDMQYGVFILPVLSFSLSSSVPIGGFLENKLGMKPTLLISSVLIEIFLFLFINQVSKLFTMILVILIGMSIGLAIIIPVKTLCRYYPDKKGLIGSICSSCMTLIPAIICVCGESFINPESVVLKKDEIYYPEDISANYKQFYKIGLIIIPVVTLFSIFLMQNYDPKLDNKNTLVSEENEMENKKKDENYSKNIKAALLNKRIWILASIFTFTPFGIRFLESTFRVYGALASVNGTVIKFSSLFTALSIIIFGPIWGIICDKISFNIIIKFICISSIIIPAILSFFLQYNIIYIICVFAGKIITCGFTSISQPFFMKIYGIKYYLEIGGIIGIIIAIFNILDPVLSYVVSRYYKTGEELRIPYRIIYIIGTGLSVLGFILGIFQNDEEFEYPSSKEEKSIGNLENKSEDGNNI